ncbi:MAG: hypothetical protein AAGI53_01690 [Planctomycetota bacterium]
MDELARAKAADEPPGLQAMTLCPQCAAAGITGPDTPGAVPPPGACEPGGGVCGGRRMIPIDPGSPPEGTRRALDACAGVLEVFMLWRSPLPLADVFRVCEIDDPHPALLEVLRVLPSMIEQLREGADR